jgi:hypothetical protein
VAGSTLAATLGEQAAGLAATAEQLVNVATGFVVTDERKAAAITALSSASDGSAVSGWAPPSPPVPPDARPPLPPPPPAPGEAISAAVHSGDPAAGEPFISAWSQVASSVEDAAGVVRSVADHLPDNWNSPIATDVVRAHLLNYADALTTSGSRARTLADQADLHSAQTLQARQDIPAPQTYAEVRQQRDAVALANFRTGGAYAIPLATLNGQLADLDAKTVEGVGSYSTVTDTTTAGEVDLDGDGLPDTPADPMTADEGQEPGQPGPGTPAGEVSPEMAGQLASMLPGMIPAVLGAVGGLVGGAVSTIGKVPEALAQAGMQAAGAATQSLSGLTSPKLDDPSLDDVGGLGDDIGTDDFGAGGGAGETTPAAGGAPSTLPPVIPSTGAPPTPPSTPTGALPQPVAPSNGPAGMGMPMAMPMGGMMPPGGGGAGDQERNARPKNLATPLIPHTESVTGKASAERIAVSATAPKEGPQPPGGDDSPPPQSPRPIIRRISTVRPRDEES